MTSIFKRKKSKNEIEEVVVEKVIAEPELPDLQLQQQQQQLQQQDQVESSSDKKVADPKSGGKSLKGRFLFSLSRPSKRDDQMDLGNGKAVTTQVSSQVTESVDNDVTPNHVVTNGDAKSETKKSRWSRRTKASPPPPPPPTSATTVTKANGVTVKPQAPQPPVTSSPEPAAPPPLAPKGLKGPMPVSASMTSLRNAIPNGVTPNGRQTSQPATPTTERRSELVTKLRQSEDTDASQRDAKMLLRSGLEPGTEDINLTELGRDEEAGIQDEKAKRKNPQVNFFPRKIFSIFVPRLFFALNILLQHES